MKTAIIVTLAMLLMAASAPAQDTAMTGFVDASYFENLANRAGEFGLDQAELDVDHQASEKTLLRADLEWVKVGDDFVAQVEQAFLQYTCSADWTFTFGRFNAPIGFEKLDPDEMYQYSHSLVFDYGLPVNLTGAMIGKTLGERFDVVGYGVNGWDINAESNKIKTWGGRLGYTGDISGAGVSVIGGKEGGGGAQEFNRTVFDADLGCTPDGWVFGADINHGKVTRGGADATWSGFLVMAHHDFTDRMGLTVRADYFDDQDGYVFGKVGGEAQTRSALTIAPTFVLDDGFGALIELRVDKSDQNAFADSDGKPTDMSTSVAFEMTYGF